MTSRNGKENTEEATAYKSQTVGGGGAAEKDSEFAYIGETVDSLRQTFDSGRTKDLKWRENQLDGLIAMMRENETAIFDAAQKDIGKSAHEEWFTEIQGLVSRIKVYRKKLRSWVRSEKVPTLPLVQPAKSYIIREPLGVVLVIGSWNFPIELCLAPLAGAVAAGNCALLKPSEMAPAMSKCLASLLPKYVDNDGVKVVEGGVPETSEMLKQKFDHIFYTGNSRVGRIIMEAAAAQLTPVTLELGGKCPCIVDASADLDLVARRVIWGKLMNCGQICVATDYMLVHEAVYDDLLRKLKETIIEFYGQDPQKSPDYGRIINTQHHRRLVRLLNSGGTVYHGGETDEADRYIAPTILIDTPKNAAIFEEEIFGPLLPILKIKSIDEAITHVKNGQKPLALYVFSQHSEVCDKVLAETSSGGAGVNCVLLQLLGTDLPFGGVGESGMGKYHGRYSIDTFSNLKGVVDKAVWPDLSIIYPPNTPKKKKWLRRLLRFLV